MVECFATFGKNKQDTDVMTEKDKSGTLSNETVLQYGSSFT